jgi:hypothetical protein
MKLALYIYIHIYIYIADNACLSIKTENKCIALETYLQVRDAANVALLNGTSYELLPNRKTKLGALM